MAKFRCKETGMDSLFGNFLYEQNVLLNCFLRKLSKVKDWDRFTGKLLSPYKGRGGTSWKQRQTGTYTY